MFFYLCADKSKNVYMFKLGIILLFSVLTLQLVAQDEIQFVFENNPRALDINSVSGNGFRDHPMGNEISKKLELLKSRYTYIVPASPTSPTDKTVVIKPVIYNSILKLNRYYKKELKSENITLKGAQEEFLKCINIALIIYAENTDEFEQYLRKAKKPDQIIDTYNKVILE